MNDLLEEAVQNKRKILIDELIKSGVYKVKNKHLYEMTLGELEQQYQDSGQNEMAN